MTATRVNALSDPQLDIYRSLRKTNQTRHENLFIVEGATVTKRLFQSRYRIHSVLVTDNRLAEMTEAAPPGTRFLVMPKAMATELVGFKFPRSSGSCLPRTSPVAHRSDSTDTAWAGGVR